MGRTITSAEMTQGPLLKTVLWFGVPIICTSLLQLTFNAADMVIAGRFAGEIALAAVGATTFLVNGFVNFLTGIAVGANVAIARYTGMRNPVEANRALHTAVFLGLFGGVLLGGIGFACAEFFMHLLGTPPEVLPYSVLYLKIYFTGVPAVAIFNLCTATLRSVGDTKHPMYFLGFAGALNLALNLLLVIVFRMGVAGVACATVISQATGCVLLLGFLQKGREGIAFSVREVRPHRKQACEILRVGLPAGMQSIIFAASNLMIQSGYNSFGSAAVAGNSAAGTIEQFVWVTMTAFEQAAISFVGQNMGAGSYKRVPKVMGACLLWCNFFGIVSGWTVVYFARPLLGLFSPEPAVIAGGYGRLLYVCGLYFLCGSMNVVLSVLRGMGHSLEPMLLAVFGVCGIRGLWVRLLFPIMPTLNCLYQSYPVSWFCSLVLNFVIFYHRYKRLR